MGLKRHLRRVRRRRRLYERQHGLCFWCGCETVLLSEGHVAVPPPNMATFDHIDDRFNPLRGKIKGERTVMACWGCNQLRCRESVAQAAALSLARGQTPGASNG